jgi:acetoin utilization protein AcuB
MTKPVPQIKKFMTTTPHTIGADQTLDHAKKLMHELSIRHLPVLNAGAVIGIISERDISFLQSFKDIDLKNEKVEQAMTLEPVTVNAEALLDVVCREMAEKKIGSVLVKENNKLVGIFTWIDALKAMDELMQTRLK